MAKVYIGLGTNLGDKEMNLRNAISLIKKRMGEVLSSSAFYSTAPWGFTSDHSFLNAVVCIETLLSPRELLAQTQTVEKEMGRVRKSTGRAYSDRVIDIDLLIYDELILKEDDLQIPHPLMTERSFVMKPLAEIAPELLHPVFCKTIRELLPLSE